jgi:hypothetical protein
VQREFDEVVAGAAPGVLEFTSPAHKQTQASASLRR